MLFLLRLTSNIFLFILLGFFVGKIKLQLIKKSVDFIIFLSLYFLIPIFLFVSVWQTEIEFKDGLMIILVAVVVVMGGYFWSSIFSKFTKMALREVSLPIIFMNSAYLAIPLNTLFFGKQGMLFSIFYSLVISVIHFTFGIYLITNKGAIKEITKLPIIYSVLFGIVCNVFFPNTPFYIEKASFYLKSLAFPFMLSIVGYQLSSIKIRFFQLGFGVSLFRIFGGFIVSIVLTSFLGITGSLKSVIILSSTMPSAISNYILAKKYNANPDLTASSITVSTFISVLLSPLYLFLRNLSN